MLKARDIKAAVRLAESLQIDHGAGRGRGGWDCVPFRNCVSKGNVADAARLAVFTKPCPFAARQGLLVAQDGVDGFILQKKRFAGGALFRWGRRADARDAIGPIKAHACHICGGEAWGGA